MQEIIAYKIATNFWHGLFGFAILFIGLLLLARLFDKGDLEGDTPDE